MPGEGSKETIWGEGNRDSPRLVKKRESIREQRGVKELQKYKNSDGFSLTVSQYSWQRQRS